MMKIFSDLPERILEIIQILEKSSAYDGSSLLKFLTTQLYLKTAKFLTDIYRFRDQIMFSSAVSAPNAAYNGNSGDPAKAPPNSSLGTRESVSLVTVTRSDIVAWIMRCWTTGIESFHVLEQIRIISIMTNVLTRLKVKRKRLFFLRQLYNLLGSVPHPSNSIDGIHQSTEENKIDSVIEVMKKVTEIMSMISKWSHG